MGVTLDNRVTFKKHIETVLGKADNICKQLYPLIKRNGFATKALKLKIFKTYVRPSLLYAAPILIKASNTNLNMLQVGQNKFIRMIMNANIRTRVSYLHEFCKLEMTNDFLRRLDVKFREKCNYVENPIIRGLN